VIQLRNLSLFFWILLADTFIKSNMILREDKQYVPLFIFAVKDKAVSAASAVKDKVAVALSLFSKGESKFPLEYNLQFFASKDENVVISPFSRLGGVIVVELIKDGKDSFLLKISSEDAAFLYEYLDNLNKNSISILFNGKKIDFKIIIDEMEYDLIINNKSIILYMESEEIQFFKCRLNDVIDGNSFYPSEVCERKYKNKNVIICCIIE